MTNHRRPLLAASLALCAPALLAQEPSPSPWPRVTEEVVVSAVRADEQAPVTTAELTKEDLERAYHGQEIPVLLARTPSVVQYSETGSGAGYSYFFLRGLHQSRVNMTLDGVPLNDPEESAVFFANFGDFGAALESVQIQRGVGTSSVGAASFAGSVNFESAFAGGERRFDLEGGLGSWGTGRGSAAFRSGEFGPGMSVYARASLLRTDGYRERSGVDQHAFYLGLSRQTESSLLKVFGFTAEEDTELAFFAPDAASLDANPRVNIMAPGETDAYGQDFLHVHYTRRLGTTVAALQGYYSGAAGAFRLWDDPVAQETLRAYGIDGRTLGVQGNVRVHREAGELIFGAHANTFERDHFQDVVGGDRTYTNTGHKDELSGFAKGTLTRGRLHLYADAQVRHAEFSFDGQVPQEDVAWTFFNPKAGLRVAFATSWSAYASVGRTTREPARNDLFAGEDDPTIVYDTGAVRPERVTDVEAGVEHRSRRLRVQANVYAMEFRNEIAATGELSIAGFPLRRNAPKSFRRGVEFDAELQARDRLVLRLSGSASHDRLREWQQFFDVYDEAGDWIGQEQRTYSDVRPLLTPPYTLDAGAHWTGRPLELGGSVHRVGRVYLDNTMDDALSAPAWTGVDLFGVLHLDRWVGTGEPRLRVEVTNVLDERIRASGYSYLFLTRGETGDTPGGTAYFYPLATRSVYVTLQARF